MATPPVTGESEPRRANPAHGAVTSREPTCAIPRLLDGQARRAPAPGEGQLRERALDCDDLRPSGASVSPRHPPALALASSQRSTPVVDLLAIPRFAIPRLLCASRSLVSNSLTKVVQPPEWPLTPKPWGRIARPTAQPRQNDVRRECQARQPTRMNERHNSGRFAYRRASASCDCHTAATTSTTSPVAGALN